MRSELRMCITGRFCTFESVPCRSRLVYGRRNVQGHSSSEQGVERNDKTAHVNHCVLSGSVRSHREGGLSTTSSYDYDDMPYNTDLEQYARNRPDSWYVADRNRVKDVRKVTTKSRHGRQEPN